MLYGIDTWVIGMVLLAVLSILPFLGIKLGLRVRNAGRSEDPELGTVIGSILGLLALLLGFTFSMAATRFDRRKQLIVEEANAIGTTYLRAEFLPDAQRADSKKFLREYVRNRISLFAGKPDPEKDAAEIRETARLQTELWNLAVAAGRAEPTSNPVKLYLVSLNQTLDLHDVRVAAMENHVPEAIFIILFLVAGVGTALVGYGCGVHGRSGANASIAISVLSVLVIMLIIDLDRPRRGAIQVSPSSLERLHESLKTGS